MNNLKIPTRPAPTIPEARQKVSQGGPGMKKKPPPRPPPPNFNNLKSNSTWNLNNPCDNNLLIDWSPPSSPGINKRQFGGSISSSFSSSTSSLASSKKSFDYDSSFNVSPWNNNPTTIPSTSSSTATTTMRVPTIIRAQPSKKPIISAKPNYGSVSREKSPVPIRHLDLLTVPLPDDTVSISLDPCSPPMPNIPPPSPPKQTDVLIEPFGIALYDYKTSHPDDLSFEINDIIYLIRQVNEEWYCGKVDEREGMFPANYIDVQVALPSTGHQQTDEDDSTVTAIYEFQSTAAGCLPLKTGDRVMVIQRLPGDWLLGACNGKRGQFPTSYVNRIPDYV